MRFVFFDDKHEINFWPLSITRPVADLRVGILKLRQRLCAYLEADPEALIIAPRLAQLWQSRHHDLPINNLPKGDYIFVNTRLRIDDDLATRIRRLQPNIALTCNNQVAAARLTIGGALEPETLEAAIAGLQPVQDTECKFWERPWDFIENNAQMITKDFEDFFYEKDNYFETETGVTVLDPYQVWIGENATLAPGVVVDCTNGPVVIDEGATIMPNAVVIGPAYIGKNSIIKIGAKIYEGTTIGPVCKVGGEVEESIFHGYSNKQHDGFLGHSLIGEWVNIGADTNNSDLKNNYSNVKVWDFAGKTFMDTGSTFIGCQLGDHTKIGINCSLNTGLVAGVGCNLYGAGLFSGFVNSFSWGQADNIQIYQLDKFLQTAAAVKARRKQPITEHEKELYKNLHSAIITN